jgi:1L-myo-inositol 1-phosphate cytidylyltransferase
MVTHPTDRVRQAVVLAAGNGDRFHNGSEHSKLLTPVAGTPLLIRTLAAAANAGITDAHLVLGYDADCVRGLASSQTPSGLTLHFHLNRDWHRENGLSVLAARSSLDPQPFALMMGDHIFETDVLRRLLEFPRRPSEALLGVDTHAIDSEMADEATKVRLDDDGLVTAIGKALQPYDALDTGLFVCDPSVFEALEASCVDGDSTLSGGIARLAARRLVRGVDIGRARWCDVDTLADLAIGERLVERESCA